MKGLAKGIQAHGNDADVVERITAALIREERRAERFANQIRFLLLVLLTAAALINFPTISAQANLFNIIVLTVGFGYGIAVHLVLRRMGYRSFMKYATSLTDVILVFVLLFLYTRIDVPTVALKNYVFLILFPLIGLTVFRYDRLLTVITGLFTVVLYFVLTIYLHLAHSIVFTDGGYMSELFSAEVTYVGQFTKILILSGYIILMSYLAEYSRKIFIKIVSNESNLQVQQKLLDHDLTIASDVQNQLQMHIFPDVAGLEIFGMVEQGRFVGGDYCDFLKLSHDKMLIVIADVSGKGVPAALIMSEVRATVHVLASGTMDLEQLIRQLNTVLIHSTRKKDFVSFFAAQIDTSTRSLQYVNAGHPPSLLLSNGIFQPLDQRTVPLGIVSMLPDLRTQSVEFHPGNILVSYTDGLFERMNPQKEQFGEERLRNYILTQHQHDVRQFSFHLMEEVKEFGQGRDLDDDVSIAVVKFILSVPS